jgi:hypothetical protein
MPANLGVSVRWAPGTQRAIWSRDGAQAVPARSRRRMSHALVRFAACAAWLIGLASIVSRATGYALTL